MRIKYSIFIVIFLLSNFGFSQGKNQYYGFLFGMNLSKLKYLETNKKTTGLSAGIFNENEISSFQSIRFSISYTEYNKKYTEYDDDYGGYYKLCTVTINTKHFEIPIVMKFLLQVNKSIRPYVSAGPLFSFFVEGKGTQTYTGYSNYSHVSGIDEDLFNMGFVVGGGVDFFIKTHLISMDFRYNHLYGRSIYSSAICFSIALSLNTIFSKE